MTPKPRVPRPRRIFARRGDTPWGLGSLDAGFLNLNICGFLFGYGWVLGTASGFSVGFEMWVRIMYPRVWPACILWPLCAFRSDVRIPEVRPGGGGLGGGAGGGVN